MKKFLKIIIPCYNCKKTISIIVDSILNQTCKDFFVVLVDDMSTDGTLSVLKDYEQKYPDFVKAVQVPEKAYADGAREYGFRQYSDAEFTWFVDADDKLADENVVQTLKDIHQEKQLDLYTFNCNRFKFDLTGKYYSWFPAAPWFRIARSNIIKFKTLNIIMGEDVLQSFLMYDSIDDNRIFHIDKILYEYTGMHAPYIKDNCLKVKNELLKLNLHKEILKKHLKKWISKC